VDNLGAANVHSREKPWACRAASDKVEGTVTSPSRQMPVPRRETTSRLNHRKEKQG